MQPSDEIACHRPVLGDERYLHTNVPNALLLQMSGSDFTKLLLNAVHQSVRLISPLLSAKGVGQGTLPILQRLGKVNITYVCALDPEIQRDQGQKGCQSMK